MSAGVTPHLNHPLERAAELMQRVTTMANARNFSQVEAELLTSLMAASCMLKAFPDHDEQRWAVMRRIHAQAVEFIELELVQREDGEPTHAG